MALVLRNRPFLWISIWLGAQCFTNTFSSTFGVKFVVTVKRVHIMAMLFQYPDSLSELCIAAEELLPLNLERMV